MACLCLGKEWEIMNKRLTISLNGFDKVKNFVNKISVFESDIDAIRNHYVVDAKSILGMFTLDLLKPIDVEIHSDNEEEIKRFNEVISEFLINE